MRDRGAATDRGDRARDADGARLTTLALKLLLTPALIAMATLAERRFGPAIGGWLVGLPFTSGPVALFLALEQGEAFAADAGSGFVAGAAAAAAFAVAYAVAARRLTWRPTLVVASAVFLLAAVALRGLPLAADFPAPLLPIYLATLATLAVAIRAIAPPGVLAPAIAAPPWDLPARMVVATTLVLAITAAAPLLGPQFTGLLTTYPIYASVLAAFAHVQGGRAAATHVVRGLCFGLFAFASFFFAIAALIERAGVGVAFAAAIVAAAAVQAASLGLLRLTRGR